MSKPVYKAFSVFEFIKMLFLRGCMLVAAGYCFSHFEENPIVVSIATFLCLCFVVFMGDDRIIVYPDRVVQKDNSLAAYWFNFKGHTYSLCEMEKAYLDSGPTNAFDEGVVRLLTMLLPRKRTSDSSYPIHFLMKDGSRKQFTTNLEIDKSIRVIEEVNAILAKKKKVEKSVHPSIESCTKRVR